MHTSSADRGIALRQLLALAVCAWLLGCGTRVTFTGLNSPPAQMTPRNPASVDVYTSGPPSQPFVEVGLLEAQQESAYSVDRQPQVLQKLRTKAAEMGCDGIILLGSNDAVVGGMSNGTGWTTTLAGYRATCIMYYQPWSAQPQPAQAQPAQPAQPSYPPPPAAAPPPQAGSCTRDSECPANGICEGGVCLPDPSAPPPPAIPCARDSECPANGICEGGVCIAG